MPYEEEDLQWGQIEPKLNQLTQLVIGAAIEVHRHLGAGLDELLYERAMAKEMRLRQLRFEEQIIIPVDYKSERIGEKRLDFIVERSIVLELKAIEQIHPVHKAQVLTYLRITGLPLGLLVNFNVELLKNGIKRIINT
ncbi:MAG: GxxExxY protein [Tepidisphaeraceae bacterium]